MKGCVRWRFRAGWEGVSQRADSLEAKGRFKEPLGKMRLQK